MPAFSIASAYSAERMVAKYMPRSATNGASARESSKRTVLSSTLTMLLISVPNSIDSKLV
ncbi:hypothetical protein D3C71_1942420 [compost metagenome]